MKLRNKLSIFALAALLIQLLAGCRTTELVEPTKAPGPSGRPTHTQELRPIDTQGPDASEEPTPTPTPDLWDPEHRLDIDLPRTSGLELPVSGATGYATVKLPLWPELPEEEQGKLTTIYAPPEPEPSEEPSSQPEPTEEPSSQPEPSEEPSSQPEPSAAAPADPAPAPADPAALPEGGSGETSLPGAVAGIQILAPMMAGEGLDSQESIPPAGESAPPADGSAAPDPAQSPGDEPFVTAAPTQDLSGESEAGPVAEPSAELGPEPSPEASPEASPEPSPEASLEVSPEPSEEPEPTPEPTEPPDPMEGAVLVLGPGTAFTIIRESGPWWEVEVQGERGWIEHQYCLINLPDVAPSIIYNDTNSYSSVFVSSGRDLPNVTGQALYNAEAYNPRLGYSQFLMPVLYTMAKRVAQAQQNALEEGNTIILYEAYRPYSAQMAVVRSLTALSKKDSAVKAGISTSPWNISWFIATGSSNHQEGYAMDVSLAKVTKSHVENMYGREVVQVDEYEEYTMPTPIHELSMAAATYTRPIAIFSNTAWRRAEMTSAMAANEPAKALQRYCTDASLTPLASEWWHFNDLAAYHEIQTYHSRGEFEIKACVSTAPW